MFKTFKRHTFMYATMAQCLDVQCVYRARTPPSEVIPENGVEVDHDAHKLSTVAAGI